VNIKLIWFSKLDSWRTDVLVRGLGFMLYLTCLGHWGKRALSNYLELYPLSSFLLGICGFALMVAGVRLITLSLTAVTAASFLWTVLQGRGGSRLGQQAAEYPMLMLFPAALTVLALVLFFAHRRGHAGTIAQSALGDGESDLDVDVDQKQSAASPFQGPVWQRINADFERGAMLIFRWATLATLFFAGFHKLNTDFFTELISCEHVVKQYAARNWSLPGLEWALQQTSPALIVLMESVVPILLLLSYPRLGVLMVVLFYGGISLTDALVVTLCIIIPALAFLPDRDWKTLQENWRKPVLFWGALLLAWLPFSSVHYRGSRPWMQPALYQGLLLLILVSVIWLLWREAFALWKRRGNRDGSHLSKDISRPRAPRSLKSVVAVWIALLSVNGFSPYLGLKFNYSFAMLSNLRVDDARWNHFLMPKGLRLTSHDGFVHVLFAETHSAEVKNKSDKGDLRLRPGLFSPMAFHDTLDRLQQTAGGAEVKLLVEYKGQPLDFVGSVAEPDFASFRKRLPPPGGHWLHDYLSAEGPMGCKH
jgi:hypothetical protein